MAANPGGLQTFRDREFDVPFSEQFPDQAHLGNPTLFDKIVQGIPESDTPEGIRDILAGTIGAGTSSIASAGSRVFKELASKSSTPAFFFHGTGQAFDKFDITKIGSGEGVQAFGWGLYFAADPKVAKQYARRIGRSPAPKNNQEAGARNWLREVRISEAKKRFRSDTLVQAMDLNDPQIQSLVSNDKTITESLVSFEEAKRLTLKEMDRRIKIHEDAVKEIQEGIENALTDNSLRTFLIDKKTMERRIIQSIVKLKEEVKGLRESKPTFMRVEISDDVVNKTIEWDFPAWRQPDNVHDAFVKLFNTPQAKKKLDKVSSFAADEIKFYRDQGVLPPELTGEELYRLAAKHIFGGSQKSASSWLNSQGVPGIKFLDGNSRWRKQGFVQTNPKANKHFLVDRNGRQRTSGSFSSLEAASRALDTGGTKNLVLFSDKHPEIRKIAR